MPVSQKAVAVDWGVKAPYVHQKVKEGCPLDSLEAARAWRQANCKYGVGYRSKSGKQAGNDTPAHPSPQSKKPEATQHYDNAPIGKLAALEDSLKSAIANERLADEQVAAASPNMLGVAIGAANKAREGRLKTEEMIQKLRERENITITMDAAKAMMRRTFIPLLNRLRSLGRDIAFEVNPSDDVHAEKIITEKMEALIAELRTAYDPGK
jgi:major membrane immunogen (membrane-anchored lipoprotein)